MKRFDGSGAKIHIESCRFIECIILCSVLYENWVEWANQSREQKTQLIKTIVEIIWLMNWILKRNKCVVITFYCQIGPRRPVSIGTNWNQHTHTLQCKQRLWCMILGYNDTWWILTKVMKPISRIQFRMLFTDSRLRLGFR